MKVFVITAISYASKVFAHSAYRTFEQADNQFHLLAKFGPPETYPLEIASLELEDCGDSE